MNLGNSRIQILVQGNRFLYKMMRNLAGSIAYAGCGKIAPGSMREILGSRDRRLAGVTAPAHGLYLGRVFYKTKALL
jgi:tRNA pseudouridine38-40 synthase